jgi:hypothetical protein
MLVQLFYYSLSLSLSLSCQCIHSLNIPNKGKFPCSVAECSRRLFTSLLVNEIHRGEALLSEPRNCLNKINLRCGARKKLIESRIVHTSQRYQVTPLRVTRESPCAGNKMVASGLTKMTKINISGY